MTEKRFKIDEDWGTSLNGLVGVILQDNEIIKVDRVVDLLNTLHEENIKLRTLNYVNKEAVRLNNIKTVKIGREDVDCSNINWELLYELYNKMIDFYYDESGDLE